MLGTHVPALNAAHKAALAGGKPLVCECPPAWWTLHPVFAYLTESSSAPPCTVVIVPEIEEHDDLETVARRHDHLVPIHLATGIARTARVLRQGAAVTVAATPLDLIRLVEMSSFKTEAARYVMVAWPEAFPDAARKACETLLAEFTSAARIIVTSDRTGVKEFLDRHAHRAPVYQAAADDSVPHGIRYAVVPSSRKPWALRAALDIINPSSAIVWDPPQTEAAWQPIGAAAEQDHDDRVDLAVATDLPSSPILGRLAGRSETVLVLIRASQLPYLRRMAPTAEALRLPSAADRARHGAYIRRAELREKLEADVSLGVLTTLEPLLDEFDPVLIAAAAIAERWQGSVEPDQATWTTVRVDKGKKDGIRAGDLVGALVNAVGLHSRDIGRIDLRGTFSLIDIRPEDASRALRGLTGVQVRGQRLSARLDDTRRAGSDGFAPASRSKRP